MKNCIILGAGRSGTSMVAGTLADAGYYMGDTLLPPTEGNPKGYFESREVEAVNDGLIHTMRYPTRREKRLAWLRPIPQQPDFDTLEPWVKARWLALIPPVRQPILKSIYQEQIEALVKYQPFCFKDPRFSYTLPAWRPFLNPSETAFICVFREPAITAASILKEVQTESYLDGLTITYEQVMQMWVYSYRHILTKHRHAGSWLFLHYSQVLTEEGLNRIEMLLDVKVNRDFPEARLQRTQSEQNAPRDAQHIYRQLCSLAGYIPHA